MPQEIFLRRRQWYTVIGLVTGACVILYLAIYSSICHGCIGFNSYQKTLPLPWEPLMSAQAPEMGKIEKRDNKSIKDFMLARQKVNQNRRENVRQKCALYPELIEGGISNSTYQHIFICDRYKLLYCFIPKVGCSNWKRIMMILNGNTKEMRELLSNEVHEENGMKLLSEISPEERQRKLKNFKKFIYVRNPLLRVLSAYKNKFEDIQRYRSGPYYQKFGKAIMKEFRRDATARELETGENITWIEFVDYLTQPQRTLFDDHWEEMFSLCSPCKINYDYIGHLDTVNDDAKYMFKELNLKKFVEYPPENNSHPTNSRAVFDKAFRELSKYQLRKLWKMYAKDFDIFGYPKPDFILELQTEAT